MIYKAFQDLDISALGLGAMRLPIKEDNPKNGIDEERVREMLPMLWSMVSIIMIRPMAIMTGNRRE